MDYLVNGEQLRHGAAIKIGRSLLAKLKGTQLNVEVVEFKIWSQFRFHCNSLSLIPVHHVTRKEFCRWES